MSAYGELDRTGALGDATVALLRRLARQYTRTHSFRPPAGYARWSDDAVDDLLAELFVRKGGPKFVLACWVRASDDASLERLLLTAIGNFCKDLAKATERGKLRRRLDGLLGRDPRFVRVPAAVAGVAGWRRQDRPATVATTAPDQLEAAARSVRGVASITSLNTAGPTPVATQHALLTVVDAVLAAADGAVRDEDLARAVESRFILLGAPTFVTLHSDALPGDLDGSYTRLGDAAIADGPPSDNAPDDAGDDQVRLDGVRLDGAPVSGTVGTGGHRHAAPPEPADPGADPAEVAAAGATEAHAQALWSSMTPVERVLLPHLHRPDRALAEVAGIGPRQARAVADGLVAKLRAATLDDPHYEQVLRAVLDLCGGLRAPGDASSALGEAMTRTDDVQSG